MTTTKLDPALCRRLAKIMDHLFGNALIPTDGQAIAEQLSAAADLAELTGLGTGLGAPCDVHFTSSRACERGTKGCVTRHADLTEERVREVRAAILHEEVLAGRPAVVTIADRAAKELAGTVVTAEPSPAPDLSLQQHAIDIVFDGPPGPTAGRFVEVEDLSGKSVGVGQWIDRCNGMWALRIPRAHAHLHPDTANIGPADTAVIDEALEYTAARKPGAAVERIARIRAALTSGGGS